MQYYCFLQKCGEGDLYVSECFPDYFIVTGTPGLSIFWELKAKQKGYEYNRYEGEDRVVGFRKIAYDEEYIAETEKAHRRKKRKYEGINEFYSIKHRRR